MSTVEGVTADHHKYVVPGLVDEEVVERQSRVQAEKLNESSFIHYHKYKEPCTVNPAGHSIHGPVKFLEVKTVTELPS